jgi:hypothetical protein
MVNESPTVAGYNLIRLPGLIEATAWYVDPMSTSEAINDTRRSASRRLRNTDQAPKAERDDRGMSRHFGTG